MRANCPQVWRTTRFTITLDRPLVMGVVNCSPDSFADAQPAGDTRSVLARCEDLLGEGADLLDIGAESSRPGAVPISPEEELSRLLPVLRVAVGFGVPVSVDTCKPEVMRAVLDVGVDIINDITGLRDPESLAVLSQHGRAGVCLMHLRGTPQTMSGLADYRDVVAEVRQELSESLERATESGIEPSRIVLDPGYGFAKKPVHSWRLLAGQAELKSLGRPILAGVSRKGMIGAVTGQPPQKRRAASVAAAVIAAEMGAHVLRVHDVADTVDALKVRQHWNSVITAMPAASGVCP